MQLCMDSLLHNLDWSLVASFLAVAEEGSLSAAARKLDRAQPTVGRQVRQLEEHLGFTLFDRQPRGLVPTEKGAALIAPARAMRDAAMALSLAAAGEQDDLAGTVRITASVFTSHHTLPPVIAALRQEAPEIQLEIVPSDSSENLLFREADIALRMYRSEQLEIVTRKIGDIALGVYAAKSYLDRVGYPETMEALFAKDFVGYDRSELILKGMQQAGIEVAREWFPVRCDHHAVYFELVRAGCGIGFAQTRHADKDPDLVRLFPQMAIPPLPLYIAAHETVRRNPRVARVWDMLVHMLNQQVS